MIKYCFLCKQDIYHYTDPNGQDMCVWCGFARHLFTDPDRVQKTFRKIVKKKDPDDNDQ